MSLALIRRSAPVEPWLQALGAELPDVQVVVWPDFGPAENVEFALGWQADPGTYARFPNLKVIFSLGAGVDHLLNDPTVPAHIPLVRMTDTSLTNGMVQYVLLALLRVHRGLPEYERQQSECVWRKLGVPNASPPRVGILGLGTLGGATAQAIASLGYPVSGWSRAPKSIDGVRCCHGAAGLANVLAEADVLVCLLPLTPDTTGILNHDTFQQLPRGAHLINVGRGEHLVEADLLQALRTGQISGATLDVFVDEPLAADNQLWREPGVLVTPHVASDTIPRTAAVQVAANIARLHAGEPLVGVVTRTRGY